MLRESGGDEGAGGVFGIVGESLGGCVACQGDCPPVTGWKESAPEGDLIGERI